MRRRFVTVTLLGLVALAGCGGQDGDAAARDADLASQQAAYEATRDANPRGERPEPDEQQRSELTSRISQIDSNIWSKKIPDWSRYTCDDIWKGELTETRIAMNAASRFTTGDADVSYDEGREIVSVVKEVFCHD